MDIFNREIDGGKAFDWGRASSDYARYRDIYPPVFFGKVAERGLCVKGQKVLDLGTGGGFPGIPLAILFPQTRFTLCDSIGKKTLVARSVAQAIQLQNVTVVNARAETLPDTFDDVVSRAVAALDDFYPWVRGKYTRSILYLKGGDVNEEIVRTMTRWHLPKGSVSTWKLFPWLTDEWFDGKMVIHIRK